MDKVDFCEIEYIFDTFQYLCTDNEKQWYECMWHILDKQQLTAYDTEENHYQVILYAVTLLLIYSDFSYYAFDDRIPTDYIASEMEEDIPTFLLGQLYAMRFKKTVDIDHTDEALLLLADSYRDKVISAIKAEIGLEMLFVSLYAVHYTFQHIETDEDGDEIEKEIEPQSAEEFWKLLKEEYDSIISFAGSDVICGDFGLIHVYDWIMDGAHSEKLYIE